jgi:hypothetical protein
MALIVWHTDAGGDGRFDYAADEEQMRQQMIDYNNEVLNEDDEDEHLPDDATLEEAIEKIEERENVSYEEVYNGHQIESRERDTILAALRLWQAFIEGQGVSWEGSMDQLNGIVEIANNDREPKNGVPPALTAVEIDALCERINS